MAHEDVLGLSLGMALSLLKARGIADTQVIWTDAPKNPQPGGYARVVAVRQEGRILVAARFTQEFARE